MVGINFMCRAYRRPMATVEFRTKRTDAAADAINRRVSITRNNTIAGLLNNNFKIGSTAMSLSMPRTGRQQRRGHLGDEFANLLGKMTGERPPEWVVELHCTVNASVNDGIPVRDWMAALVAWSS